MRLGLVVEGSHLYHRRTKADLLDQLWRKELGRIVGSAEPAKVFGISKGSLAAMKLKSASLRRTTSIAEPLDAVLERLRLTHNIDCFIVVWDLLPPWDKQAELCRWTETLAFYEGLSLSDALDASFRDFAADRFREMRQRARPGARRAAPRLIRGAVIPVCVDPLFESVFMNESAMKSVLGLAGKRKRDWPRGWNEENPNASDIIATAIDIARDIKPTLQVFKRIPQGYESQKTEWGIYFLQTHAFDQSLRRHSLCARLAEITW